MAKRMTPEDEVHLFGPKVLEQRIEQYLVKRVKELGGQVRKVRFDGHRGAPDRLVMCERPVYNARGEFLHYEPLTVWVELKRPGLAATFPATAHERQQHREHQRMRGMGQRVEVIDSIEAIEALLP